MLNASDPIRSFVACFAVILEAHQPKGEKTCRAEYDVIICHRESHFRKYMELVGCCVIVAYEAAMKVLSQIDKSS